LILRKYSSKQHDLKRLLIGFFSTVIKSASKMPVGVKYPGSSMPPGLVPYVVCASFCTELYLKCLVLLEGKSYELLHSYRKLFDALEADTQASINKIFDDLCIIDPHPAGIKEDLDAVLTDTSNAFVSWRYLYEKDPCDPPSNRLILTLRKQILKQRPELMQLLEALNDPKPVT